MIGIDLLGATIGQDQVVTIPSAGQNYTDAKTVAAVQSALVKKGYDLGSSGPNNDGVDGIFGSKTKAAIQKLQASVGADVNGRIDETVISALQVTPGVLPKGVSIKGRAALQAQVALDAATAAEHAQTPSDVSSAADSISAAAEAAAPPPPPDVQAQVKTATAMAKAAKTPADVKAAADALKSAGTAVHEAVKPAWYSMPTWQGGPERWKVGLVGLGAAALAAAIALIGGRKKHARAHA